MHDDREYSLHMRFGQGDGGGRDLQALPRSAVT